MRPIRKPVAPPTTAAPSGWVVMPKFNPLTATYLRPELTEQMRRIAEQMRRGWTVGSPPITAHAQGGMITRPGVNFVGDTGPEWIVLPHGANIIPASRWIEGQP